MFIRNDEKVDIYFKEHGQLVDLPSGSTRDFPEHLCKVVIGKYPWVRQVDVYEAEVIPTVVTEELLEVNPELKEEGVEVGSPIEAVDEIPKEAKEVKRRGKAKKVSK